MELAKSISPSLPQRLGIIFSRAERNNFATADHFLTEKDAAEDAKIVANFAQKLGFRVFLYPADGALFKKLKKDKPELIINLVDSIKGRECLSSAVPGFLEMLGFPYTGADLAGCALCYNKFLAKKLLAEHGIKVPPCQLMFSAEDKLNEGIKFPMIAKLNEIHGGVEMDDDCVSEEINHLKKRAKKLLASYCQPLIVEEFIEGREITAIFFKNLGGEIFLAEKIFAPNSRKYQFVSFDKQWKENGYNEFHYQKFQDDEIKKTVGDAFKLSKMKDYGKFDIRLNEKGEYFFIDANPNPAFGPKESQCALSVILDMYGFDFTRILKQLLSNNLG